VERRPDVKIQALKGYYGLVGKFNNPDILVKFNKLNNDDESNCPKFDFVYGA
jgi:hypothetical protein